MEQISNYSSNCVHNEQSGKKLNTHELKRYTLDEAIQLAGHGRFNILVVILSGIAIMGATIENLSLAFVLSYANCDLNMTTTELGLASSIPFFGIIISSHFWGFLADTWGRKKVMRLTAICALISSLLSAFSTDAPLLILLRFFVGLFISGLQASVFSYVSEFHTKQTAPRATSFTSIFMSVTFIYSSIFAIILMPMTWSVDIWFIKFVPWRLYIIAIALVNFVNAITFSLLPETPKFLLVMNKSDEALDVLKQMYKTNTGNPKELYPVKHLAQEVSGNNLMTTKGFLNISKLVWNQTKGIFVPPYLDSTLKLCFLVFTLFSIGHGIMLWLPDFLIQLRNDMNPNKTLCDVIGHEREVLTSDQECNFDKSDTTTFQIMLGIGCVFTGLSTLISFYLNKIAPKIVVLTAKFTVDFSVGVFKKFMTKMRSLKPIALFSNLSAIWLIASAVCSVALNFITQFHTIVVTFVIFQSCSQCATIVCAICINLFPTNIRAMATCFILLFGRIGGLAGTNLVGALVEHNCNLIFNAFGALAFACTFIFLLVRSEPPAPVKSDQRNVECSAQ